MPTWNWSCKSYFFTVWCCNLVGLSKFLISKLSRLAVTAAKLPSWLLSDTLSSSWTRTKLSWLSTLINLPSCGHFVKDFTVYDVCVVFGVHCNRFDSSLFLYFHYLKLFDCMKLEDGLCKIPLRSPRSHGDSRSFVKFLWCVCSPLFFAFLFLGVGDSKICWFRLSYGSISILDRLSISTCDWF